MFIRAVQKGDLDCLLEARRYDIWAAVHRSTSCSPVALVAAATKAVAREIIAQACSTSEYHKTSEWGSWASCGVVENRPRARKSPHSPRLYLELYNCSAMSFGEPEALTRRTNSFLAFLTLKAHCSQEDPISLLNMYNCSLPVLQHPPAIQFLELPMYSQTQQLLPQDESSGFPLTLSRQGMRPALRGSTALSPVTPALPAARDGMASGAGLVAPHDNVNSTIMKFFCSSPTLNVPTGPDRASNSPGI